MAIKYINYTRQQQKGMAISGYSLYVNGSYLNMYEHITIAKHEADRYSQFNDVEVYPVLRRRY